MDTPTQNDEQGLSGVESLRAVDTKIADVIRGLDMDRSGTPTLRPDARRDLCRLLERALVNGEVLKAHVRGLRKQSGRPTAPRHPLPTDQAMEVVEGGLGVLTDAALVALAGNPVALADLRDRIAEQIPRAWFEAMERDGRLLVSELGLSRGEDIAAKLVGADPRD